MDKEKVRGMQSKVEYEAAKVRLKECLGKASNAYRSMREEEYGFTEGDIVEYHAKGEVIKGIFNGWHLLSNGEEPVPNMTPFKRDGTPSGKNRILYDLRKVRFIKKASA